MICYFNKLCNFVKFLSSVKTFLRLDLILDCFYIGILVLVEVGVEISNCAGQSLKTIDTDHDWDQAEFF
jgi:hypothetical protein